LLTEQTQEQAAAKAGVSPATLRRWLSDPAFVAAFRAARRQIFHPLTSLEDSLRARL
jgi:hypothetical protein